MTVIEYLNDLSLKYRQKHLTTIETRIIELLLQDLRLEDIGATVNYSRQHLSVITREIYGLVAQETRATVNKSNFISIVSGLIQGFGDEFRSIYGINKFKVDKLTQKAIEVDLSSFWKFDAINMRLIFKGQYPVTLELSGLTLETLGTQLLLLNKREVNPYAIRELMGLLTDYFEV